MRQDVFVCFFLVEVNILKFGIGIPIQSMRVLKETTDQLLTSTIGEEIEVTTPVAKVFVACEGVGMQIHDTKVRWNEELTHN